MASENRTQRRYLSQVLLEFISKTPKGQKATRTVKATDINGVYYVFLLFPFENYMDADEYRRVRSIILEKHLYITKLVFPEAQHIVGIATETGRGARGSEDAAYFDAQEWSDKDEKYAKEAENELKERGLLGTPKEIRKKIKEYPYEKGQILDFHKSKGRSKNLPCICGSGRKFKKCCGASR